MADPGSLAENPNSTVTRRTPDPLPPCDPFLLESYRLTMETRAKRFFRWIVESSDNRFFRWMLERPAVMFESLRPTLEFPIVMMPDITQWVDRMGLGRTRDNVGQVELGISPEGSELRSTAGIEHGTGTIPVTVTNGAGSDEEISLRSEDDAGDARQVDIGRPPPHIAIDMPPAPPAPALPPTSDYGDTVVNIVIGVGGSAFGGLLGHAMATRPTYFSLILAATAFIGFGLVIAAKVMRHRKPKQSLFMFISGALASAASVILSIAPTLPPMAAASAGTVSFIIVGIGLYCFKDR